MFSEGLLTVTHSSADCQVNVLCGFLTDAKLRLTFVGNHDIVDPDIVAPDIDTIETTFITTTNSHVVDFTICASVDGEVERGRVNQGDIMNRPV